MKSSFAILLESFFTQRLMKQILASPHTIKSYRDTFHLLLEFAFQRLKKQPSELQLKDIDAPLIISFLDELEKSRNISARTRNARLAAIRSFFRYAAFEVPERSAQIKRILAIPSKRHTKSVVEFLTKDEIAALLAVPDKSTWSGRRDHALLLLALQTGLRLSEIVSLQSADLVMGSGAHVRVIGKGRKERCTPLTKQTAHVMQTWIHELATADNGGILFPNARKGRLSADGVQHILAKHLKTARNTCPSLNGKRITPHVLRHSCAMQLLHAGIDRAMIALWLGHESIDTTQVYLHANLALKEKMLSKTKMPGSKSGIFRPDDQLLAFLKQL
ncbi:MAG: tyrosine-type recombinase/integrase [Candidatus Obscuribacterales bacterium]|nr:tyrosine-type recombinase/integrase [Cyanobacteria bacterium SZAS LIN-5]